MEKGDCPIPAQALSYPFDDVHGKPVEVEDGSGGGVRPVSCRRLLVLTPGEC